MTEQPVETEQQFLGNAPAALASGTYADGGQWVGTAHASVPDLLEAAQEKGATLAEARQHYVPNAHLRRPSWSPVDDVELASLVRKSVNANKLLAIAKGKAAAAEDALSLALGVENEAFEAVNEADQALIAFTRKDTGL